MRTCLRRREAIGRLREDSNPSCPRNLDVVDYSKGAVAADCSVVMEDSFAKSLGERVVWMGNGELLLEY